MKQHTQEKGSAEGAGIGSILKTFASRVSDAGNNLGNGLLNGMKSAGNSARDSLGAWGSPSLNLNISKSSNSTLEQASSSKSSLEQASSSKSSLETPPSSSRLQKTEEASFDFQAGLNPSSSSRSSPSEPIDPSQTDLKRFTTRQLVESLVISSAEQKQIFEEQKRKLDSHEQKLDSQGKDIVSLQATQKKQDDAIEALKSGQTAHDKHLAAHDEQHKNVMKRLDDLESSRNEPKNNPIVRERVEESKSTHVCTRDHAVGSDKITDRRKRSQDRTRSSCTETRDTRITETFFGKEDNPSGRDGPASLSLSFKWSKKTTICTQGCDPNLNLPESSLYRIGFLAGGGGVYVLIYFVALNVGTFVINFFSKKEKDKNSDPEFYKNVDPQIHIVSKLDTSKCLEQKKKIISKSQR